MASIKFDELMNSVSATGKKKLPSAAELRSRTSEEIFIQDADMGIIVFHDGFYLYSRNGYSTVFAVDRCMGLPDIKDNGRLDKSNLVPNDECGAMDWIWPLITMGERRLDRNQAERENSIIAYHISSDGNDWFGDPDEDKPGVHKPSWQLSVYEAEEREKEDTERKHELLVALPAAKEKLTARQREVVDVYYGTSGMTEAKAAKILSEKGRKITQQGVHKNLDLAHKKLGKVMGAKPRKK